MPPTVIDALDLWLGRAIAVTCSALLTGEMFLLLTGVIARYLFQHPLVWVDELSSALFLWLAMLGAALALRSASNMRMSALINRTRPATRACFEAASAFGIVLFLGATLLPAFDYVADEQIVSLTTIDVSMAWRASAMPVGIGLMLLSLALRLRPRVTRPALIGIAAALVLTIALAVLAPALRPFGNLDLILFFLAFTAAAVLAGVPIAFAFGLATLGYLGFATDIPLSVLLSRMDAGMSHPILLSIPLFVFLGQLLEMTGMAEVIVACLANLLGHVRGGLSYVLIAAMYLVSGISGSKAADMAAIAPALFPEMAKRGIPRGDLAALLAATGAQTETIPPSLILITIGSVTGLSIASLFSAGLMPALVGAFFLASVVWFRTRSSVPSAASRAPGRVIGRSFLVAMPALILPFIIRAAIVEGVATATEVSTIGIVYCCLVGALVYRKFDLRRLGPMLVQTATLSGAILLIVGAATAMAWTITQTGVSRSLAQFVMHVPGGAASFLALSILIFIVLGSVLEGIPAIVLMGPLLFPAAKAVGLNEIHYAIVAVFSMGVGLFSPPFGVGYYVACAIGEADPDEGLKHIGRYLLALLAGLFVIATVPWLTTFVL